MMKAEKINLRDPFVLVYDNRYYLYGTRGETAFADEAFGFDVYVSEDLEDWEGPHEIFHRPENFWSRKCYWAPEVYRYQNRFFMFATFADEHNSLGTAVLVSDSPEGPFEMHSDGYVTPSDWRCLDGTLYVSEEGKPYMVFCHEWVQIKDGTICAMELSEDLKKAVSEPRTLFSASSAEPFVREYQPAHYVTDGPFLIRTPDGKLHMLWSTYGITGYVEATAHSDSDEITGTWKADAELLYDHDGGHGMIFKDLKGNYCLSLHYPNTFGSEHPRFIPLEYTDAFRSKD